MPVSPDPALAAARHALANPDPREPLAVRQMNWGLLKAARDQDVHLDRLDDLARATAQVMTPRQRRTNAVLADLAQDRTARAARISDHVRAFCARTGHPYHGPFGGDAA